MNRLLIIAAILLISAKASAQGFPNTDSLRTYNIKYITNNAATAFTNLRLHTLLRGIIDHIDTARSGGGAAIGIDTLWALNDSTIRYRKNGAFKNVILEGVYDTRRKVDTAYALNDTTLQIKINGTNRNIIIPGRPSNGIQNQFSSAQDASFYIDSAGRMKYLQVDSFATFAPIAAPTYNEGRYFYDNTNKTITVMDDISGTSIQLAYENLLRARNNTGSQINDAQVVYISGAMGQNPTIALAQANSVTTSQVIGMATHNIANNSVGKVTTFGLVNDINTSAFNDGDKLWLSQSTPGAVTNVEPTTGLSIFVGYCLTSHVTQGKIFVHPQSEITTLQNALNNGSTLTVNNTVTLADSLKFTSGDIVIDSLRLPALLTKTDTTANKPIAVDASGNVVKMAGWPGGGAGGGLTFIYSATAPTGTDTSKIWVKTPIDAGVYDVFQYVTHQGWQRYGWQSVDGFFSPLPPVNVAGAGQSNMAGTYSGGDTARVTGILAFTSGSATATGEEYQDRWEQATIGKSPFYNNNNNMVFAFAKQLRLKEHRIVRIILTYKGGIGLSAWLCGSPHYLLDTLRNRISRSGVDTLHAFLWHHGESGGCAALLSGGYLKDMQDFYDTLCAPATIAFHRNVTQFIAGELGGTDAANRHTQWEFTNPNGAIRYQNRDGNINTASVPSYNLSRCDATHFCGTALDTMGIRMYGAFKEMPHTIAYEQNQLDGNYDTTYEKLLYDEANFLLPASGGGYMDKFYKASFSWTINGLRTLAINADGSVGVANAHTLPASNYASLKVAGGGVFNYGSRNLLLSSNFNVNNSGGGLQDNVVVGNYNSSWTGNANPSNVLIGTDAHYRSGDMPYNTIAIGYRSMYNFTPAGLGDLNTFVGSEGGTNGTGRFCSVFGARSGQSISAVGLTLAGYNINPSAGLSYSVGAGYETVVDSSFQVALGNSTTFPTRQFKVGTIRFKTDATPSNGHTWVYDATTSEFKPQAPTAGGIYGGSGSLPGNVVVTGANNSITFDDIFAFRINSDYNVIAKANGTGTYTEAVIGTVYEIGFTPTPGTFSKGAGVFIDTNNNVGMGVTPPTTMPLYATGASTFIQGLQSNAGNFYRVNNINTNTTLNLTYYFITVDASGGNVTITLPAASTAFGNNMGISYVFQRTDNSGNTVTVQRAGSDTVNGATSFTLGTQYETKNLICTSTSTWAQH